MRFLLVHIDMSTVFVIGMVVFNTTVVLRFHGLPCHVYKDLSYCGFHGLQDLTIFLPHFCDVFFALDVGIVL